MATPMMFRKKPVVIEAIQCAGEATDAADVYRWINYNGYPALVGDALNPDTLRYPWDRHAKKSPDKGVYINPENGCIVIRTLEGDMQVSVNDWIIRGVQGELYPCKPDIFAATYETLEQ